jgi:tetratricopeptide (TPR) repeat protein
VFNLELLLRREMKTFIKLFFLLLIILVSAEAGAADGNYEKALQLFKGRDYKNAVVCLEKYVAERPDPAAYYMLGYASYELGDFDKAREYFDAAYLIDPDFSYKKIFEHSALFDEELMLIHEVLEISGAKEQISYYADVVGSGLPQFRNNLSEQKIRQELTRLIKESFRFDKIYPSVVQVFQSRFQKEHLMAVLSWLKTPVGRKMTALEIKANNPEAMKEIETFASEYQKMGETRKKLLMRLEKAINATEMNIEVVSASLLEMLKSMQSQTPERNRLSSGQIDAIVEKIRNMPREQLKNNVMVSLAYTYRELADKELETAIQFYETPAGKWFNETSIKAITSAIGKASREIGEQLGKALVAKNIPI